MRAWLVVTLLLLAGCASDAPADDAVDHEHDMPVVGDVLLASAYHNITGTLRSLPAMPGEATGDAVVLPNTGRITVTLLWSDPVAALNFDFVAQDAAGVGHNGGRYDSPGAGRVVADIPAPTIGNWTYTVSGSNAVDVAWTLVVFMAPDDAVTTVLAESYVLAAGSFFEINTQMDLNGTMNWDWAISEGSSNDFNVHTHFDNEAQYLVQESVAMHAGQVVADRAGGYSLMWENPGPAPQTIVYKAWGDFTVDSYFPPR